MNLEIYDFETKLERGFATALANAGKIPPARSSYDIGEQQDECIVLVFEDRGLATLQESDGDYSFRSGQLRIGIQSPRFDEADTDPPFQTPHAELVARVRHALGHGLLANLDAAELRGGGPLVIEYCRPASTEREIDEGSRKTELVYDVGFSMHEIQPDPDPA